MLKNIDWTSVAAISAGMLVAFVIGMFMPGLAQGCWSLPTSKPVDLPAWLQAVGGLIGIGIAIYVPWRQRRNQIIDTKEKDQLERERERQLHQIMSIALFQPVETYRGHCEFLRLHLSSPRTRRQSLPDDLFDRPPEFDQFREKLQLLGKVGLDINKLIAHQDVVRGNYRDFLRMSDPLPKPFVMTLSDRIDHVASVAEEIKDELRKALNPVVTAE